MNIYSLVIIILLVLILVDKYSTERFSINYKNSIKKEHFNSDEFDVQVIHMEKNRDRIINFRNYYIILFYFIALL
jgi:hypothetical protein